MSKKEKRNTAIRILLFCIILLLAIYGAGKVFIPFNKQDTNQAYSYYNDIEDNSADLIIAGGSTVMVGISGLELWKNEGITVQTLGNSVQSPAVTYLAIRDAYRTQSPKVVIIGLRSVFSDYDYNENESFVRRGMDFRKLTPTKLEISKYIVDNSDNQTLLSYIFPLLRYHSRWSQITYEDFENMEREHDYMHGQYPVYRFKSFDKPNYSETDDEPFPYDEESWRWYKKTAEYCESKGTQVIFALNPYQKWTRGRSVTAQKLADEAGAVLMDLNKDEIIDEYGIDWSRDFYDDHHMNAVGAQKATAYIAKFLREHCDLPNRGCSDTVAAQFDADLDLYEKDLAEFREKKYDK